MDGFLARMRFDRAAGVARDSAIQSHGAIVEEIKRPDVQRSSREVNSRRRSRFNPHLVSQLLSGYACLRSMAQRE